MEKKLNSGSVIIDGGKVTLSGVTRVLHNNNKTIAVKQGDRTLTLTGDDFNVTELNVESGRLTASGNVRELKYTSSADAGGFIKKLFK